MSPKTDVPLAAFRTIKPPETTRSMILTAAAVLPQATRDVRGRTPCRGLGFLMFDVSRNVRGLFAPPGVAQFPHAQIHGLVIR